MNAWTLSPWVLRTLVVVAFVVGSKTALTTAKTLFYSSNIALTPVQLITLLIVCMAWNIEILVSQIFIDFISGLVLRLYHYV